MFTEVVIADIDVLSAWTKFWKSCKFQCTRIIFKDLAYTYGLVQMTAMLHSLISLMRPMIRITSQRAMDMAIYSASVVERATWD